MSQTTFLLRPVPPFRLDLAVWVLRRRPQNLIDRWEGTTYRRVIAIEDDAFEVSVSETARHGDQLRVTIQGQQPNSAAKLAIRQAVVNALGLQADLHDFYRTASRDAKLGPLANRFRGMKPARFLSVFEGLINGIACQQVSLTLGIQLLNRLSQDFGLAAGQNSRSYAFPRPEDLAGLKPEAIRKLGFNFRKAHAMVEISRSILEGRLDLEALAAATDEEALQTLMALRGVGRWTAELTMLRGMGRWHIFPVDDLGARNGLARWLRLRKPPDAARARHILARWNPYGGLIYFHMLLNGLDAAGWLSNGSEQE